MNTIPRAVLNYRIPIDMPLETLYDEYFVFDKYARYVFTIKYIPLIEEYRNEFTEILKEKELTDEYFMNLNIVEHFQKATYGQALFELIDKFHEILLPVFFIERNDLIERCYKIKEDLNNITTFVTKEEYEKIFIDELKYDLKNICKIRRTIDVS